MNIIKYYIKPLFLHPLNKNNKLKAFFRFIKWQIVLRVVSPLEIIVPFVGNSKFIVKKGLTGLTGNLYSGLHEFYDMIFLLHFLRDEDIFFDVGANVGSYSILSAGYVGAFTYSFEPVPHTYTLLESNKAINPNSEKWFTNKIALGNVPSRLFFSTDNDTMNRIVDINYLGHKITVDVSTLDTFCHENNVYPVLMKIDAEGFDEQVLLGASNLLMNTKFKALIIEGNSELVMKTMNLASFLPYSYNPYKRTFELGGDHGSNQLYIRDLEFANQRVLNASKVSVLNFTI
jgi:FkbM family methyltransferase